MKMQPIHAAVSDFMNSLRPGEGDVNTHHDSTAYWIPTTGWTAEQTAEAKAKIAEHVASYGTDMVSVSLTNHDLEADGTLGIDVCDLEADDEE
jgi:hypothetical protein